MDNINLYLKVQRPISFYDVCTIYQPSFDEILDYGIDEFEKLLLPYYVTVDNLPEEITDEEKEGLNNFDLLCSSGEFIVLLGLSLEFFCKSNFDVDEKGIVFISKLKFPEHGLPFIFKGRLNKDNFDEFADIVLKICGRERQKKDKKPVFENDNQRKSWEKLQEGRKRNAKNNEVNIEDILNYCEFGGNSYIPIEEIKKWSLWRIMNCYKSIVGTSAYKDSFSIYLVSGEKALIENKHWTDLLKINYQYKE